MSCLQLTIYTCNMWMENVYMLAIIVFSQNRTNQKSTSQKKQTKGPQQWIPTFLGGNRVDKNCSYQHGRVYTNCSNQHSRVDKKLSYQHGALIRKLRSSRIPPHIVKAFFEVVRFFFQTGFNSLFFRYNHHKRANNSLNYVYETLQSIQFHMTFVVWSDVFTWIV